MDWVKISSKAELDAALAKGSGWLDLAASLRVTVTAGSWRIRAQMGFRATVVAWGDSSVEAWGNSSVEARENSSVEAWGNSSVVAWENSSVVARENSSVVAWENSSVVARENSSVEARGNSSVEARENSSVEAWENSSVVAWQNSSVVAWENSSVEARGNSSVVARENSSVEARGNSSVVAWENSSVVAWENSSVEARENSSVVARGNVFVRLFSALKLKASAHVAVMLHGKAKTLEGGRHLEAAVPDTAEKWCEHYGVEVKDGNAMLFKAVDDDWSTDRARRVGITYAPGQLPVAADWDGGKVECGAGLHASPHPRMAQVFNRTAKKFVCCPVALSEIAVHPNGSYPEKVKFRGCAAPTFAVDVKGKPVEVPA